MQYPLISDQSIFCLVQEARDYGNSSQFPSKVCTHINSLAYFKRKEAFVHTTILPTAL